MSKLKSNLHEKTEIAARANYIKNRIKALYDVVVDLFGADRLVLRASKLHVLDLLRSENEYEQMVAIHTLIFDEPIPEDFMNSSASFEKMILALEDEIAEQLAKRMVEEDIDKRVSELMQEKQDDYVRDIKHQVIKEKSGPETPHSERKLEQLVSMEAKVLKNRKTAEYLRPQSLAEIIGQDSAIEALMSKISSAMPQHVLLFGPPGVGKTSSARLALEEAKNFATSVFGENAPFIEVNGATLRWDARGIANPLIGTVHDPIYQGAKREMADSGLPEPKLGLVSDANGGILFIDEIGEMDPLLLNKLLKVLEDKRVYFESTYYDHEDENVPAYIKKIFKEGAPADFILIGATTRSPDELNPALRSRCAEVYFQPLTPLQVADIVRQAAKKLKVKISPKVIEQISNYTIEGRKAVSILMDSYGLACYQQAKEGKNNKELSIKAEHVQTTVQNSRLTPYVTVRASQNPKVGHVFALGVYGFLGSILEIEAVVFPAKEKSKGIIRFNETAGTMSKDSVFNASSVIRKILNTSLEDYDVHVNVIGGANIDGPSAGLAITLAIISALENRPMRQDIAITGEISLQGYVRPVGGIPEKIYGARQANMSRIIIPQENRKDVPVNLDGIIVDVITEIEQAMKLIYA